MTEHADVNNRRRPSLIPVVVIVALLLAGLAGYCQSSHKEWRVGHYSYRVLPLSEWSIATVYYDGTTRCWSAERYGFIERTSSNVR